MPSSLATTPAPCTFASATAYGRSPIHHSLAWLSAAATPPPGATLSQPRMPYDPATRPMSINRSGGLFDKLLHQPPGGQRKLRTAPLPVLHPLHVDAQRLAPLGRLRIVEAQALEKLARGRPARIGHHQVEERTLVGAAALQSNHHHLSLLRTCGKPRIIRENSAVLEYAATTSSAARRDGRSFQTAERTEGGLRAMRQPKQGATTAAGTARDRGRDTAVAQRRRAPAALPQAASRRVV